jgi:phosphatidylethanolamine-binding protein (PEBP) family uncharacterized protein
LQSPVALAVSYKPAREHVFLAWSAWTIRADGALAARKTLVLRSPEVADGGQLPKDYTGDGTSSTLPLEWSGAPDGTKSFALIMHHVAPDMTKWYWILYNIPVSKEERQSCRACQDGERS